MPRSFTLYEDYQNKRAKKLNPADRYLGSSLACLHSLAWGSNDPDRCFRRLQVQRDETAVDAAEVEVPERAFVLDWDWKEKQDSGEDTCPGPRFLNEFGLTSALVRQEYIDILQEIMDTCTSGFLPDRSTVRAVDHDHDVIPNPFATPVDPKLRTSGAIIIGNPGIGKSVFLVYLLALRVLAGKTTIFQSTTTHFYVLNNEGVFRVPFPIMSEDLDSYIERGTWCLFDSNRTLKDPPECFTNLQNWFECFIVQATPPSMGRVHWANKAGVVPQFWMAPWSLGELIAARDTQTWMTSRKPTESQLASFCKLYGSASPRIVFNNTSSPENYKFTVNRILDRLNKHNFAKLLTDAQGGSDSGSDSDFFIVATPNPEGNRTECKIDMISESLAEKVLNHLRQKDKDAALYMYWNFITYDCTRSCAKYFLEKAFLEQFPRGGKWPVTLMNKGAGVGHDTDEVEIHWKRNASWSNRQYLLLGYKASDSPVKITTRLPFPVPKQDEFSLTYHEFPPEGPIQQLEDGFFRSAGAKDQTMFDSFTYDTSTQTAILFHLTVERSYELIIANALNRLKDAQNIDLVIVTCPNQFEGTEDVFMRKADYDELCKGRDNEKLRDVYLLELDVYP